MNALKTLELEREDTPDLLDTLSLISVDTSENFRGLRASVSPVGIPKRWHTARRYWLGQEGWGRPARQSRLDLGIPSGAPLPGSGFFTWPVSPAAAGQPPAVQTGPSGNFWNESGTNMERPGAAPQNAPHSPAFSRVPVIRPEGLRHSFLHSIGQAPAGTAGGCATMHHRC